MNGDEQRQVVRLAAFPLGIRSEKKMGKIADPRALIDGLNLDLSAATIRTRKGSDTLTSSPIAAGNIVLLKQAHFPTNKITRLIAQVDTGSANKLYGCKVVLPSASLTFSELYDLTSGADVLDMAQLNDRAIFTEILKNAPLVWGGAMETDGSDWMIPKAILWTLDGTNFHNYTDDLCDTDSDTTADIGSMTSSSFLYINVEVPQTSALYFDMGTANTVDAPSSVDHNTDFASDADIVTEDFKKTITNWVRDDGVCGHFTDGSNPVTIGAGNTAPEVVPGTIAFIGGSPYSILHVIDDGEATGEVILDSSVASGSVSAIVGLYVSSGSVKTGSKYTSNVTDVDVFTKTLDSDSTGTADRSYRFVIPANQLSASGSKVKVTLQAGSTENALLDNVSIGVQASSGNEYDTAATPTELLFGAGSGIDIGAGTSETSDWTDFWFDSSKDHVVIFDVGSNAAKDALRYKGISGIDNYRKDATNSYNDATPTGTWTHFSNSLVGIIKIEVTGIGSSDTQYVAYTADSVQISTTTWDSIDAINSVDSVSGSATLFHALCWNKGDSDEIWKVYLSGAWRGIAKLDSGTWKYNDADPDNWVSASTNNRETALQQAFADSDNQMNTAALEALAAEYSETGGFTGTESTLDFSFAMTGHTGNYPALDKYITTATTDAAAIVTGYNGSWSQGYGWTDGTASGGASFAQDGALTYNGTYFTATYHQIEGITGYWFRVNFPSGTSSGTTLAGIKYKAPCQSLAKLAPDGIPDLPVSVVFVVAALGAYKDITTDVTDDIDGTAQYLNDGGGTPTGWTATDALYIGSAYPFNAVQFTVGINTTSGAVENNQNAATMTVSYWDGDSYAAVSNQVDGTSASSKTLIQKGVVSWTTPSGWKQNNPIGGAYPLAYWVKITVNATLTAALSLAEVKVYPVPTSLNKYAHCATKLDRLLLGNRTDNPAQLDVSREIEEYGIQSGDDSFSYTPSSQDSIVAMAQIYNEAIFFTQRSAYLLTGDSPSDFEVERLDVGEQVPINARCLVLAPTAGATTSLQIAAYYLNTEGAFSLHGFQTRVFTGLQRASIGDITDWWDEDARPYLDKDYLHLACGQYWPEKSLVVFSVPMIVDIFLDSGSAVANKGGGKVGLPCTGHGLASGTSIIITGLVNYSGTKTVDATSTANEIVITATYVAETVTEAGAVHKTAQTSNNRLICFDVQAGIWHPAQDIAATALCLAYERNTSAPGNLGKRFLACGTSAGNVVRLFDSSYSDDDGTAIDWEGKTGWLDFGTRERKRFLAVTCFGLTEGASAYLKVYINGRKTVVSSDWSFTFTGIASLPVTREFSYDSRDPGLCGIYEAQFVFGGTGQADCWFEIEFTVDPGDRVQTGTLEDTGHSAY